MAKWNVGNKNGRWKGGRTVASNGYVLIRVGVKHHLADVRGYAYEHRIIIEEEIGRRLRKGEQVHHKDSNRQNNSPDNLHLCKSGAENMFFRRGLKSNIRLPGQKNKGVSCACGCGRRLMKFDHSGRPRRFVSGHN